MDPASWRKKAGLSLRALAKKLGCGWSSVRRWESGECEPPNSVVLGYEKESSKEVSGEDFQRLRRRYLRAEAKETAAA